MRGRERIADAIAGQPGRQRRKALIQSLEETAARAVVTASVTFAVGWVLKRMFEKSVNRAAKEGAEGVHDQVSEETHAPGHYGAAEPNAPAHPATEGRDTLPDDVLQPPTLGKVTD